MSTPPRTADLGPGDFAFLGFVANGLTTAYEIKKAMAGSISYFWSAAHSQVYQQAARLERDGYVRSREESAGRRRKLLSLTPKGRTALRRWLNAMPAEPIEFRDEMLVKLFFASQGAPGRAGEVLGAHRDEIVGIAEEFEGIRAMLEPASSTDERARHALLTLRLGIRIMRTYLEWIDETLTEL